jgi:hypothetical protein
MARPSKNNCDYFPHDNDMRNHRKVKALRTKFGITGYAFWSMFIEFLTGADGNVFCYDDVEIELLSGDFGISATEMRSMVDYCIQIELLFIKDGFVNSISLDENLSSVYEKRNRSKEKSSKQLRVVGKFVTEISDSTVVSATEIPQSKLNKNKEEKSKVKKNIDEIIFERQEKLKSELVE